MSLWMDPFGQNGELEVQKYLPSFPVCR